MSKPRTAKRHFTRDIILVFLFLSVAVIAAVAYFSALAQRHISQKYINDAAVRAVAAFRDMADTMGRDLGLVRDWGASGKLSLDNPDELNQLLFPILKRDRILFGISIADTDGENYYVADVGDGWRTSRTGVSGNGRQTERRVWDADQRLISEEKTPSDYDPRKRPWFFPTLSAEDVSWTLPYRFYDHKDVGVTASLAFGEPSAKTQSVVAFDILLDDLFREIQRMGPSENSRVFIFKRDAQLYVAESDDTFPDFQSVAGVKDELIQKIMALWTREQPSSGKAFSVGHNKETWWCGFQALEEANRNIWIGVMVPESDIIGGVNRRRTGLWAVGLFVVLIAGGFAFWLNRRYGRSFEKAEDRFDFRQPEASIRRLIAMGEGRTIEFKSTMRMNRRTQKTGKEIEKAWLKGLAAFMNTDGGTVLLGVADNGRIVGMEPDGFENEDKCMLHFKNLVNRHIGAELSKFIRFRIYRVDGLQVGVVVCGRSSQPVYLKFGDKESYYIRNGPSSDPLPVSKVVAYIRNRG
jgi:Schlafen, AlbA_2